MPFKYTWICDLLQEVEDIECRDPPYLPVRKRKALRDAVQDWLRKHRRTLDDADTDAAAILSILLPHTRTDRVYGIQAPTLEKLVARCLNFTSTKINQLGRWRNAAQGDLGACLEMIEKDHDCEPLPGSLNVEEIDARLHDIASRCRFSSPAVRNQVSAEMPEQIVKPLLLKMKSREKKWFVRTVLKDYGRVVLDETHLLAHFHFMLPQLLKFQNDFATAIDLLRGPLGRYHANPDPISQKLMLEDAAHHLKPKIGIKIGRPTWYKARSITNCLDMVGNGTWIIERKYDGEFCEIHVDLSKKDCLQIFSKNGKDATNDRKNLLPTIRESLKIGTPECKFSSKCILLGEMVVFNQDEGQIKEFDKIRKHVSRSGSFLGADKDSQPHPYENLMICFFDVLLVDDEVTMTLPHAKRRERLSWVTTRIHGRATRVEWLKLDFSISESRKRLIYQFCYAIEHHFEGLIVKPNAPFFSLAPDETGSWCRGFIKLKKDYMTEMGGARDVADFAVVAASYDVQVAQKCNTGRKLQWTNFYLGCLVDGCSYDKRPKFKIVAVVKATQCIPPNDLDYLNQMGEFNCRDFDEDEYIDQFTIILGSHPPPSVLFANPFVVEVLGSSFEKPPNEDFHMLRHPRILKIHTDRAWEDCVTMKGLADLVREAREAPPEGESQDVRGLVSFMLARMRRSQDCNSLDSRQTTPRSARSTASSSPLATLKTVNSESSLKHSRKPRHSAPSSTSTKTPVPTNTVKEAKSTGSRPPFPVGFPKEITPMSQQSTQWTDTIGTPPASERHNARKSFAPIWPPKRIGVSESRLGKESRPSARVESSPCPDGQNISSLRKTLLGNPGLQAKKTPRVPADSDTVADVDTPELPFYEEREALSIKELRDQKLKSIASGCERILRATAAGNRESTSNGSISAPSSAETVRKGSTAKKSHRPSEDALDVITRARALGMTVSQASTEPDQELPDQPRTTGAALAPLVPLLPGLPTPPTSSPTELPAQKKPNTPAAKLPRSPLVPSPNARPPTSSTTLPTNQATENTPPTPPSTHRLLPPTPNPLKRSLDDFDIGATPRKLPKWRSPVYGRPALPAPPPTPTIDTTPLPLPYPLPTTTLYAAPSLRSHHPSFAALCPHLISDIAACWSSSSQQFDSMGSTVGESQAYAGYAKVVLVEPGRQGECAQVVSAVMDAVGGRERVGVFDWRVVGELGEGGGGVVGGEEWERGVWERWVWGVV